MRIYFHMIDFIQLNNTKALSDLFLQSSVCYYYQGITFTKYNINPDVILPIVNLRVLSYAIILGYYNIVEILLKNNANPNLAEYDGFMTPLLYAVILQREDIIKLLLDHGAQSGIRANHNMSYPNDLFINDIDHKQYSTLCHILHPDYHVSPYEASMYLTPESITDLFDKYNNNIHKL